jgi:hypothetical protein
MICKLKGEKSLFFEVLWEENTIYIICFQALILELNSDYFFYFHSTVKNLQEAILHQQAQQMGLRQYRAMGQ